MATSGGIQLYNIALQIVKNIEPYFVVGMTTAVVTYNVEYYRKYGNLGFAGYALTPLPGDEMKYAAQITNPKYTLPPTKVLAPFYPNYVILRLAKNGLLTYLIVFNQYMQRMLDELQTALDEDREPVIESLPDPRPYCLPALFSTLRETMSLFVKGIYEIIVKDRTSPKTAWILLRDYSQFAKNAVLELGRFRSFLTVFLGTMQSRLLNVAADASVAIMIAVYRAVRSKRGGLFFFRSTVPITRRMFTRTIALNLGNFTTPQITNTFLQFKYYQASYDIEKKVQKIVQS
eukprot:TRINITY_DN4309_c0_g1_i2.p2 TRINITY_DN4309_c0_g1~~TRINITY_DN4309_c0_g1_i2.p2  ORF type:complete len:289 (+),score=8.31 TRINITY_DN4309_c0_g1_i2:149-1015(+)